MTYKSNLCAEHNSPLVNHVEITNYITIQNNYKKFSQYERETYNDQSKAGIEPVSLLSVERLSGSVLTTGPWGLLRLANAQTRQMTIFIDVMVTK